MLRIDRRAVLLQGAAAAGASAMLPALARAQNPAPAAAGWAKLNTEPYKGKQDDISFVTPDIGWYGNGAGKLFRTTDGGQSWSMVWEKPGTFIRALGFVDAKFGFLGNIGTEYYPGVADTQPLYVTRDGGATFSPVQAPGIEAVRGICGIDILREERIYQGVLRAAPVIHAAGRVGGPAAMLRSVDGGESWKVIDLSTRTGMILDVKFHSAQVGFICASSERDPRQTNAQILRTEDGGETWKEVYRSNRPSELCWKMSFPSAKVGYATVQSYQPGVTQRVVAKTTDGGLTWSELPLVDDARAQEFGIGFVDERRGWVGTALSGFETRDGGASWTPVEMGRGTNKIRVLRNGKGFRAFAIGVDVYRLDA